MSFRILGLPATPFLPLANLTDEDLASRHIERRVAQEGVSLPDRIALREARPGERVLLLHYEHQPATTPYRASHAIFVIEGERETFDAVDTVPDIMRKRLLSLRAFDADGMMVDADVVDGRDVEREIDRQLTQPQVAYIHAHYAKRGCYAARIERAGAAPT